jgi:molecular chaperone GrpE
MSKKKEKKPSVDKEQKSEEKKTELEKDLPKNKNNLKELEKKIKDLKEECIDKEDKYLRILADMNNQYKRQEKEKSQIREYALEDFFKSLLPVLDSLNKAMEDLSEDKEQTKNSLTKGFSLVSKQFKDILEKAGLEALESSGEKFNPNFHQAIQKKESSEIKEEIIDQEFVKGYMLNGRLLRASMVSVLTPKS